MGSSYDACYPSVTALAAAGVPTLHVDASELLHFRRNVLADAGLLVTVSQSGESAEVVRLIEGLSRDARSPFVVAVTNGTDNTLARLAGGVLDTRTGAEVGPSTMTFAAALDRRRDGAHACSAARRRSDAASETQRGAEAAAAVDRSAARDGRRSPTSSRPGSATAPTPSSSPAVPRGPRPRWGRSR